MRLVTFLPHDAPAGTHPLGGVVDGDRVLALGQGETVLERLVSGDRRAPTGDVFARDEVRLLEPIPAPRAIFCIGRNYAAHASETGNAVPERPIVFLKLPGSSVPPNEPVDVPAVVRGRLDYEGELVVVMGVGGAVAGYAVANDLSARDLQKAEPQWTRAKGFDASCPWGPWITTADEVANPEALRLRTWVNGELRQDASTADLIFGIERLIAHIGEAITLAPGDLILTGTPAGVGMAMDPPRFLVAGDAVRIEIEGLGAIEHTIA